MRSGHGVEPARYRPVVTGPGLAVGAGIEALVRLVFSRACVLVGHQRTLPPAQRLADEDVVQEERVPRRRDVEHLIPVLRGPAQMARAWLPENRVIAICAAGSEAAREMESIEYVLSPKGRNQFRRALKERLSAIKE